MAEHITHQDLLDGYQCMCHDCCTAVSLVRGSEIRWTYRHQQEDCCPVCPPEDADTITLEYDRVGDIPYDVAMEEHPANKRMAEDVAAMIGHRC